MTTATKTFEYSVRDRRGKLVGGKLEAPSEAALVQKLVPTADIEFTGEVGNDPRSYRVNFDLLSQLVPGFRLQYSLRSGMEELHTKLTEHGFSRADWESDRFVRLRRLRAA